MNPDAPHLDWIDTQRDSMLQLLTDWARINTGTCNVDGIERLGLEIEREFGPLGAELQRHDLPPAESVDSGGQIVRTPVGRAMRFIRRADAPVRVLLNIHLDTVYPPGHPFQQVTHVDQHTLRGPGVADAKGGLVVMLAALRAFERSDAAANLGWEVVLNPDEEIGSPGSSALLIEAARRNHAGLVFEPAMPDGSLIGARKGSGNFSIIIRGRAAHAGRDFHVGRSAILALADLVARMDAAQADLPTVTINCGRIEGGGALNIVPDLAIARFNIRVTRPQDQQAVEQRLAEVLEVVGRRDGIRAQVHGGFHSPPKPLDPRSSELFDAVEQCGQELGLKLDIHSSGGACDGNRLVAAGLPTVDTLGPRGGHLHSEQEYILIDSLTERAKLSALLLMKLARGEARISSASPPAH